MSAIETAKDSKVSNIMDSQPANILLSRLVAQQLQYFYIISSWLHLYGCCVKAFFSLYLSTLCFTKDFLVNGTFI